MTNSEKSSLNVLYGVRGTLECKTGYAFKSSDPATTQIFPTCLASGNFSNNAAIENGCQGTEIFYSLKQILFYQSNLLKRAFGYQADFSLQFV